MRVALAFLFASSSRACGGSGGIPRPRPRPRRLRLRCSRAPARPPSPRRPFSPADGQRSRQGARKPGPRQARLARRALGPRIGAGTGAARAQSGSAAATADVGDIAVIQDDGSLILPANAFDLAGQGLRFVRNAGGGYDVSHVDATFRPNLGTRLSLGDDTTFSTPIPFTFSYYGRAYTGAFVNSDGNITFDRADTAQDERGIVAPALRASARGPFLRRPRSLGRGRPLPRLGARCPHRDLVLRPRLRLPVQRHRPGQPPGRRLGGDEIRDRGPGKTRSWPSRPERPPGASRPSIFTRAGPSRRGAAAVGESLRGRCGARPRRHLAGLLPRPLRLVRSARVLDRHRGGDGRHLRLRDHGEERHPGHRDGHLRRLA